MSGSLVFQYDPTPQRTPGWFATKRGKIGSSRLEDWLATSKAKATLGQPLKARLDYEKELMFERQFGASFNNFVTEAMQDGIDLEDFAAKQYQNITGNSVQEVGCWYNDFFVASPDRIVEEDGLVEVKIVRDSTFVDVLMNGVPSKHQKQIQGQLWASGRAWCDYVCLNLTTKKIAIIRVFPDTEFHEYLVESVQEKLVVEPFKLDTVHDIVGALPDWSQNSNNELKGDW